MEQAAPQPPADRSQPAAATLARRAAAFAFPLDAFAIVFATDGRSADVASQQPERLSARWRVRMLSLGPGWPMAVAAAGEGWPVVPCAVGPTLRHDGAKT